MANKIYIQDLFSDLVKHKLHKHLFLEIEYTIIHGAPNHYQTSISNRLYNAICFGTYADTIDYIFKEQYNENKDHVVRCLVNYNE